jgi:hypothetical protein
MKQLLLSIGILTLMGLSSPLLAHEGHAIVGEVVTVGADISSSVLLAHPHGEDTTVVFTGTLTKVDVQNQTIEVDAIDRRTLVRRNVLLFIDAKAKMRHGKRRITSAELTAGQRVTCVAEVEEDRDGRLVVFDVRLLEKN